MEKKMEATNYVTFGSFGGCLFERPTWEPLMVSNVCEYTSLLNEMQPQSLLTRIPFESCDRIEAPKLKTLTRWVPPNKARRKVIRLYKFYT